MRSKEHAHDYRYFPDPDLLPLVIDESWIQEISENMPELPEARKNRFMADYSLPNYDAELLTSRKDVADYYEAAVKVHSNPKAISNWIVGDLFRVIKERKLDESLRITSWPVRAEHMGEMVRMIDQGKISGKIAKTLFEEMLDKQVSPEKLVKEKGLEQISDLGSIEKDVDQVLAAHSQQVADYRAGKDKVFGFLVGQVMKSTKGKANPKIVNEILRKKIENR
jgi:aspartyl-tRNA(Asn)/glutamyl-tRNA(Gln) amidotransferase subunit B